jgi:hypothetical protein
MAESVTAKFNRYLRGEFTPSESKNIIGFMVADKLIDIATFGRLNKLTGKALVATVTRLLPLALRSAAVPAASILGSTARAAIPLATNPYLAGTALGVGALQTQPGQQLLEMAEDRGRMDRIRFEQALTDIDVKVKKTKSKFNRAVSAGMKAAKRGTSYGKKNVISAPKKVFSTVTKMASQINKARQGTRRMPKLPKAKGPRSLFNAIKKVLK